VDYSLFYTERSLDDLAEILGYIALDDSEAAVRFGESLLDHIELLKCFPRMGQAIHKRSCVRKLLHTPILVYYEIKENKQRVEVLHLRHASRKPPKF
jgi:plasmid stabilization system protein ParE